MHAAGLHWTVDVLGESVDSEAAATLSADRYLATLDALAARGLEANVSLKLTQMGLDIDPDFCRQNAARVAVRAREVGAFVRVDMEDHTKTDITLEIARALRREHRRRRRGHPVVSAPVGRGHRPADPRANACAAVQGRLRRAGRVAYVSSEEVDRAYAELGRSAAPRRQLPGHGHPRRRADRPHHRVRPGQRHRARRFEFQMLYGVRRDLQQAWSTRAGRCASTCHMARSGIPYYMRRLAERPQNVLFILRSVLREGRGKKT